MHADLTTMENLIDGKEKRQKDKNNIYIQYSYHLLSMIYIGTVTNLKRVVQQNNKKFI